MTAPEKKLWELISAQHEPVRTKELSKIYSEPTDGFFQREWMTRRLQYWHRRGLVARPRKGCYCAPHIHARAIWILSPR